MKCILREWLINAQGEDVVAGIRTPYPLNSNTKAKDADKLPALDELMPDVYDQLDAIRTKLENHYCDMQDIEFTSRMENYGYFRRGSENEMVLLLSVWLVKCNLLV
ncbi:MAG: hypothetical protein CM1200mP10_11800 [Candidatus Neomarinimicrobiota bacterium]|nr:MAG: hypothetical protein CM1200mP10_11800 [Candidatus Neomarinimicrobiota bacterium]